jgi:ABC-type multidrug transport system ATPase subunit
MQGVHLSLKDAGKKYLKQWLFRNLHLQIHNGSRLAITGLNGSGKSTLLQILSGYVSLTEGQSALTIDGNAVDSSLWYEKITVASPYLDLPEELTLRENILFFSRHKKMRLKDPLECASLARLEKFMDQPLRFFSSGMKQRVRLILALKAEVPIILLDEPISNLDRDGIIWFHRLIEELPKTTAVIICSNHIQDEVSLCSETIDLANYKM